MSNVFINTTVVNCQSTAYNVNTLLLKDKGEDRKHSDACRRLRLACKEMNHSDLRSSHSQLQALVWWETFHRSVCLHFSSLNSQLDSHIDWCV